jgi:excisionase family DNA binding protein
MSDCASGVPVSPAHRSVRSVLMDHDPEGINMDNALAHPVNVAASRLGIGRTTLYEEIRSGRLKAIKIGGRTLLTETDLRAYIDDRRAEITNGTSAA